MGWFRGTLASLAACSVRTLFSPCFGSGRASVSPLWLGKPQKNRPTKARSEYLRRVSGRRRISVTIEGSAKGGEPSLGEFLRQLEAVKLALKHTERIVTGSDEPDVYFKIVGLSMSSPATVVLEETAISVDGKRGRLPKVPISGRFVSTIHQINQRGTVPQQVKDLPALEAYRNVGAASRHGAVTITSAARKVEIEPEFEGKIDRIIGPDQVIEGSITGMLEAINLHNTTSFAVYPAVGPTKVACTFPPHLKTSVIAGIDHNVRVVGKLRYKHWATFPHAITVEQIDVYPAPDKLPTLQSLYALMHRETQPPSNGQEG